MVTGGAGFIGDICDAEVVDTIVAEADVLFHLAANFGRSSGSDPGACLHTNVHGTENRTRIRQPPWRTLSVGLDVSGLWQSRTGRRAARG